MSHRTHLRFLSIALVASAAGASCFGPTQIRLAMSTDLACEGLTTAVYVGPAGARPDAPRAETSGCAHARGADNLGTIVLSPSGARDAKVLVEVITATAGKRPEGCRAAPAGCVVARRLVSYRRGETRALPVRIASSCVGVPCDKIDETCVGGVCLPADVEDARFCDGISCTPDAAAPFTDAGADAARPIDPSAPCATGERVVASGLPTPQGPLRVGPTHVYYDGPAADGAVAVAKAGGVRQRVGARLVTPTTDAVFVAGGSTVARLGLDLVTEAWRQLVVDASSVSALGATPDATFYAVDGEIRELTPAGAQGAFAWTSALRVVGLAATQRFVYYTAGVNLVRVERGTGAMATFQSPDALALGDVVATAGDYAASFSPLGGGVIRIGPPGPPQLIYPYDAAPGRIGVAIALDGTNVYLVTAGGTPGPYALLYAPLSTQPQELQPLLTSATAITGVASDGTCVYYTRDVGGQAELVTRPPP